MAFQYSDRLREEYFSQGFTLLRDIIPPTLLSDLRKEAETARPLARERQGGQTQRLQPVYRYEELNHQPFRDFLNLPDMQKVVQNILGERHQPSEIMGILLEPKDHAWCTNWHRDWGHHIPQIPPERWEWALQQSFMFNQLNAALYDDGSLWAVPGSHQRGDTEEEIRCFPSNPPEPPRFTPDITEAERERVCLRYARSMPNATHIVLNAGDVAFYRAVGWHIGNYLPYHRRATLHDGYYCAEDVAWQKEMRALQQS